MPANSAKSVKFIEKEHLEPLSSGILRGKLGRFGQIGGLTTRSIPSKLEVSMSRNLLTIRGFHGTTASNQDVCR